MSALKGASGMGGDSKLNRPEYEKLLKPLGKELVGLSRWVGETKRRVVIIFEGRDTAGKGGRSICSRGF